MDDLEGSYKLLGDFLVGDAWNMVSVMQMQVYHVLSLEESLLMVSVIVLLHGCCCKGNSILYIDVNWPIFIDFDYTVSVLNSRLNWAIFLSYAMFLSCTMFLNCVMFLSCVMFRGLVEDIFSDNVTLVIPW